MKFNLGTIVAVFFMLPALYASAAECPPGPPVSVCQESCDATTQENVGSCTLPAPYANPQGVCCAPKSVAPSAAPAVAGGGMYGFIDPLGGTTIPGLVARIISRVLPVVGSLFLVMFIYGGFLWFSSAGDEKKVGKARQTLINAVIGIVIVMGAAILVDNIITAFGTAVGQ